MGCKKLVVGERRTVAEQVDGMRPDLQQRINIQTSVSVPTATRHMRGRNLRHQVGWDQEHKEQKQQRNWSQPDRMGFHGQKFSCNG
jgi:hypothetical protein